MTSANWTILITAAVGAISGISGALIAWLNRKDAQAAANSSTTPKSGDPTA